MHYSKYFNISHEEFVKADVFDGLTEKDVQLHVDPMLLKKSKIPEFKGAYLKFLNYFNEIILNIYKTHIEKQKYMSDIILDGGEDVKCLLKKLQI